ncbi:zinc finger protein CONSTANS-LIKE 16 [Physcomitrium patens]|uniref:Uncharacterized protein n=1 Tax=Physcomitrium patens TaxID=3218 RepID=A0A2K1IMC5_PHYPA|nr:zinc finger protein CONSTANS-LIKE 8-like [Physcomitrium patens]PNR30428.1 hypothetical protein PHYPA_026744 [Physcomitrium patens]|eukprot:XP_024361267.1 zinc finger protein CONSTANS-LIKE 8-like [Physcomitrella patens]
MATKVANSSVAIAMAFAGRAVRACDVCAKKNAHWFCSADDAYLCTACDTQVHSANALSLRHERVRLSPNGTPMLSLAKESKVPDEAGCGIHRMKKLHPAPKQVQPARKRSKVTKPYSHHLRKLTRMVSKDMMKSEDSVAVKAELELFDFLDTDEFLNNGNQEVPSLSTVMDPDSPCSSDYDLLSSDYEIQESDHLASADSFASYFKGKAAHSQTFSDDSDQFLVPDAFDFCLNVDMPVATTTPADANIDLSGEAFFLPGDIPGLDGFESFVPEMGLTDDFSLTFDLALQNGLEAPIEATEPAKFEYKPNPAEPDHITAGPFAKFFAQKPKAESQELISPEQVKREAMEMLKCCREGDHEGLNMPSLKLNMKDILAEWSNRGEPWISSDDSISSGSDVGLVPDMDAVTADESQSGGDRDARVLRYKEKRATRLFSKKIRYEVRKVNAERRPRMKGRFVKRTSSSS